MHTNKMPYKCYALLFKSCVRKNANISAYHHFFDRPVTTIQTKSVLSFVSFQNMLLLGNINKHF